MNLRPLGYEPNELPDCSTPHLHPSARWAWGQRCDTGVRLELAMIGSIRVGKADPIRDRGAISDSTKRHCVFQYMSPEQDAASNEPVP